MPQINYFFKNPDYYYEYNNDDLSLGIKDPKTGKNLTFFEVLTHNILHDLFIDKIVVGEFKIIAVTKDGPSLYLLTDDRQVIEFKLKPVSIADSGFEEYQDLS
ncbi:MAG: hypothetical protein H0X03_00960 [Nitrosopumilus sp.]|nr:hypothetical protein [Nitrosopumilus sp.]